MTDYGATDTSTTTLSANQFPVSAVWVQNDALRPVQGGPVSTDSGGKKSAPFAIYAPDGNDVTQGAKGDAAVIDPTTSGSVIALLKGLLTELVDIEAQSTTTPTVSGTVTANQGGTWTVQPGNTANTTPWLVAGADQEVSFTTTTAQAVGATDALNYRWVSVHIASQGGSSTVTFQCSNDNSNWPSNPLEVNTNTSGTTVLSTTSTGIWHGPLMGRYFRLNVTGIASGTTAGVIEFHTLPAALQSMGVTASQGGTWNITNVSGTVSLPTGASTAAKQPALGTAGSASADVLTIQGISSMTAVKVDGSGVTQPVSGTFWQATQPVSGTISITANSAVNVAQINAVPPLMGNGTTGTGSQRVTIASDNTAFSVNAVESGTWTVQPGNTANTTAWLMAGGKTNNNAVPGATNIGALVAIANAAIPAWTEGDQVLASTDLAGNIRTLQTAGTGTKSNVGSSASSVTILASNNARKGAMVYNDSTQILYLDLSGGTASATSYSVQMPANGFFELPVSIYTGAITGIWAAANGNARVTEFS